MLFLLNSLMKLKKNEPKFISITEDIATNLVANMLIE